VIRIKTIEVKTFAWGITLSLYTFLLVFTGRFEAYTPYITKGLTPLFLLVLIIIFRNPVSRLPKEYFTYIALFVWAILSGIKAEDFSYYTRYIQLFVGIIILLTIANILLPRYNIINYFHFGLLIGALFLLYDAYINYNLVEVLDKTNSNARLEGETGNANTIGAILLMAGLSNIFIFDSTRSLIIKLSLLFFEGLLIIAIVATASRSSLLCIILSIILYIIFKLYINKKYSFLFFSIFVIVISLIASYNYIYENTLLGARIEQMETGEDGSGEERKLLIHEGLIMIKQNPFFGVGLGNFPINSSTGHYSHNDIIEISSTIGLVGLSLYFFFFFFPFLRIINLQRIKLFKEDRSRLMIINICTLIFFVSGLFKPLFIDLFFMFFIGVLYAETHRIKIKYAHLSRN